MVGASECGGGGQTGETAAPWLFMGGRKDPFIIDYTV